MQINLSGQHFEITARLRPFVTGKLQRLERHFDHVTNVHVVLKTEKKTRRAEATVHVAGGQLYADAQGPDMRAAIDSLVDKLDRQIRRHKERLTDHHRDEGGVKTP